MALVGTVIVVLCCAAAAVFAARAYGIVYVGRTAAGWTIVHDDVLVMNERIRVLEVAGTYQSATFLDDRWADPVFPYHLEFDHAFEAWPHGGAPASAAILGGGGYALAKHLVAHHPELSRIDVIEIDPRIEAIARKYFFLDRLERQYGAEREGRLRLHVADARTWLEQNDLSFDLIINDCFFGIEPEESLMSSKAARLVRSRLTPDGRYLTNVVSALEGPNARELRQTIDALNSAFAYVWVYPCGAGDPTSKDNNIVIASDAWHAFEGAWPWPIEGSAGDHGTA